MKYHNAYYVPRAKVELIKGILPTWNGRKGDLKEMSIKRLRAIFHTVRQSALDRLMTKEIKGE